MTSQNDDVLLDEFQQRMPKHELSESTKQRMLSEICRQKANSRPSFRFPRWISTTAAGVVGIAVVVAGYVAISNQHRTPSQAASNTVARNHTNTLQAESAGMQKVTDAFGTKATVLRQTLSHTVAVLDAYHYGSSETGEPGTYNFQSGSLEQYLQKDYSKFQAAFGAELNQINNNHPSGSYSKYVTVSGGVATYHDDWAVLDAINSDYQQLIAFYDPTTYEKFSETTRNQDQQIGNKSVGTVDANDLRQWNEVLFGGQLQVSDVPKF